MTSIEERYRVLFAAVKQIADTHVVRPDNPLFSLITIFDDLDPLDDLDRPAEALVEQKRLTPENEREIEKQLPLFDPASGHILAQPTAKACEFLCLTIRNLLAEARALRLERNKAEALCAPTLRVALSEAQAEIVETAETLDRVMENIDPLREILTLWGEPIFGDPVNRAAKVQVAVTLALESLAAITAERDEAQRVTLVVSMELAEARVALREACDLLTSRRAHQPASLARDIARLRALAGQP